MEDHQGILFKALTRPVTKYGVPINFFYWNILFWASSAAIFNQFNQYPIMLFAVTHGVMALILIENPSFLKEIWAFLKCRFRNFRRGVFGAAYYSPIDYKKSLNHVKK